jgi:hypothetical protein
MAITLAQAYGDPFSEFPQLRTIWPEPYATAAAEASAADAWTGDVWLVCKDKTNVIGITGIFIDPEYEEDVFLRWHGIVPSERGTGAAKAALLETYRILGRKRLVELVPDNEYGWTVVQPFFLSMGFVRDGDAQDYAEAVVPSIRFVFNLED